jgi:hypothetical protein
MSHILLLGAGFSRNWGGWLASEAFEYLLGCPDISRNDYLRRLLWRHQPTGGFEDALTVLQYQMDPQAPPGSLEMFQAGITQMFADMNNGYFERTDWEFQEHGPRKVATFLERFDAIFIRCSLPAGGRDRIAHT